MSWVRMRFRGDTVWVRVDSSGRPALDSGGRAEMKYRESDTRVYRPGLANLSPFEGSAEELLAPDAPKKPRTTRTKPPASVPAAADHPATTKGPVIKVWTDGAC